MRILITGGGGAGNESIYKILGKTYELHFADADVLNINPIIPETQKHEIPMATHPRFVDFMLDLCRKLKIDLLIPSVDEELLPLSERSKEFAPTRLMLPEHSYIKKMLDKLEMVNAMELKKIPVPSSSEFGKQEFSYPYIAKPRSGRGSRGVMVIKDVDEEERLKSQLGIRKDSYLSQSLIKGTEYTVQMIADSQGIIHAVVPVKVDIKRGITIRASTEKNTAVITACKKIHEAFPTTGVYNIQLVLTDKDEVLPFEINPRISTTFCLVLAAGIDPVGIFLGKSSEGDFKEGVALERHWTNFFKYRGEII
jgi:carbamoyl-phosphate synthase large subunit